MIITAETTSAGTHGVTTPAELEQVVLRMSSKNPYVVVTRDAPLLAGSFAVRLFRGSK